VRWRPVAATIVLLLVLVSIVGPLAFIGYRLTLDAAALAQEASSGDGGFEGAAVRALTGLGLSEAAARDAIGRAVASGADLLKAAALPTITALLSVLVNIAVFFFLLYFVLTDGERMAAFVRAALPLPKGRSEILLGTIAGRTRALFLGTFLVSIVQGVLAGLGWWFFGFPAPFFWGFVITFLTILPGGAPFLILVPAGVLALLQGNYFAGIGILVYGAVVVGTVDNLARPYIVGRSSDVHPAIVFLGTLGGLAVFGATGFIIGPLVVSMVGPVLAEWAVERRAVAEGEPEPAPPPPPPQSGG
jgi:predicted PurR-regulated permease PerM